MKRNSMLMILLFFSIKGITQDSTVVYYSLKGKATTKDSSFYFTVVKKHNDLWFGKTVFTKTQIIESSGLYKDKNLDTAIGNFDNYTEDGILNNSAFYSNEGRLLTKTFYYSIGKKMSYISYDPLGKTIEQHGWDSLGNEIPGFIVMQEASFKGGLTGWRKYLEKHLKASVPAKSGAPEGRYTVVVSFTVDTEGVISNVKAENVPAYCSACSLEAIRVIEEGPNWKPAIMNNKPVKYNQRQSITFVVQ